MKTGKYLLAVILFSTSFSYLYSQTTYSFNDGLNAANSSGKKILVDVYSNSDKWSQKMKSEVYSSSKIQDLLSNFIFVRLNAEDTQTFNYDGKDYTAGTLAKLFGATGYPTFIVMNSDGSIIKFKYNGEEVSNLSGFIDEQNFAELLNYFAMGKYKDTDLSTIFQN